MNNQIMKLVVLGGVFTLALFMSGCQKSLRQNDIEEAKVASYCGQELGAFLEGTNHKDFVSHTWNSEPPTVYHSVLLEYEDGRLLEVFVEDLKFQEPVQPHVEWSIKLLMKENFRGLIIWGKNDKKIFKYFCPKES